ncbi:MAG: GNAT family N-acetyltransferase [Planctomycetota bacterium]
MAQMLLTTERMRLRDITIDDVDDLVELDADPEVRRYVHMPDPPSREQVATDLIPRIERLYALSQGLGFWAAERRDDGAFLGWFHLKPEPLSDDAIALGYRLGRSYWGSGFATEGSRALIDYAFTTLDLTRLVALALVENTASIRVMQKVGMRENARLEIEAGAVVEYEITRD